MIIKKQFNLLDSDRDSAKSVSGPFPSADNITIHNVSGPHFIYAIGANALGKSTPSGIVKRIYVPPVRPDPPVPSQDDEDKAFYEELWFLILIIIILLIILIALIICCCCCRNGGRYPGRFSFVYLFTCFYYCFYRHLFLVLEITLGLH